MRSVQGAHFSRVVAAGVLVLVSAAGSHAIGPDRFDVGAFVGARYAGEVSIPTESALVSLDPNVSFGAMADVMVYDMDVGRVFVTLAFSYQNTKLKADTNLESNMFLDDLSTMYYHGGVGYQWDILRWKPYVLFTLGGTSLVPSRDDVGSSTEFSYAFGGGIKHQIAMWGVRLDARWYRTPLDLGNTDAICGFYSCFAAENKQTLWQGDITLGGFFSF